MRGMKQVGAGATVLSGAVWLISSAILAPGAELPTTPLLLSLGGSLWWLMADL